MTHEDSQQRHNFKLSFGIAKSICLMFLVGSEYLFLALTICPYDNATAGWIYPYAAFAGTVLMVLTYAVFISRILNFGVYIWTVIEFAASLLLFTVIIIACYMSLLNCERLMEWRYFLPEILGILACTILVLHSLIWMCMLRADQINATVRKISI